jgi:predicted nucleotidyltransferase
MTTALPLAPHAETIARRALAEEEAHRRHLVITLTGAHAYGFASHDSDLDLKGVHLASTEALLGLSAPPTHASRFEVIEGVEIDYASNELGQVLTGLLGGNGSFLERTLGVLTVQASAWLDELRALARAALSRRYHHHYRGFATGMLHEFLAADAPTAKRGLYILRTALTGTHLLRTGELVVDVNQHLQAYGFGDATELLEIKRRGERTQLAPDEKERWSGRFGRVLELLDEARTHSPLPDEAPNRGEAERWLVEVRRAALSAAS